MTSREHLKLELMVFAINHDFFGYGSQCYRQSDGRWVSIVDCEKFTYSGKQLAEEFDSLDDGEKEEIVNCYFLEVLCSPEHQVQVALDKSLY